MCDRIDKLCNNWDVLISEACNDALMKLKERDEEYALAIHRQNEAADCLRKMFRLLNNPALQKDFEEELDKVLYEVGTKEFEACYLAGAGDAIRLVMKLGLLDV